MLPSNVWFRYLHLLAFLTVVHALDFYQVLEVSRDASLKEIKRAYRKMSLEYHPDKNKGEGAAEKFAEIARAYEVLSDEDLKSVYDRRGEEGLKQHEQQQGGGGAGGFEDIFEHFGFNFGGRRRDDQEERTPSIEIPLFLSLKQLYVGEKLDLHYVRQVLCINWEMCMKAAPDCQGPGISVKRHQIAPGFIQQVQQFDSRCTARGKMWKEDCRECPNKTETEKVELTIEVTPGMRAGERITFEGVADEAPGLKPGDVHFLIHEDRDENYHRDHDDLYTTVEIPLVHALTGFNITLTHVDDRKVPVHVDKPIDCDHVMRLAGKGMPRRSGRGHGDLYITFEVDFPDDLTKHQKEQLRKILAPDGAKEEL